MKINPILILLVISFTFVFNSCSNDIDFSNSWIKYAQRDNHLDPSDTFIKTDTLYVPHDSEFLLHIHTQSNDGSKPKIYKQIDGQDMRDITDLLLEAALSATYNDPDGGYRQINEIHVDFPSHLYSSGQAIKYVTTISSKTGEITNKLYLILE